jgi:peptide deformylase
MPEHESCVEILKLGNPKLKIKSQPYTIPQELTIAKSDAELMLNAINSNQAVGLAANQIGILKRIMLIDVPKEHPRYLTDGTEINNLVMLNPEFKPINKEMLANWEGCLSLPGMIGLVPRYTKIEYSYYDLNGNYHKVLASALHARVIQHEIDHLDGITYLERIKNCKEDFGYADEIAKTGRIEEYSKKG